MITAAAHNLSFASPLGTIESQLRPFFHLSDASCLGLRGLGQVDASYGFTLHVRCWWALRRLVVLQPDLQTFANLNQALHSIHQRGFSACGALDQSCTAQDRVCYSACYTREIVPARDSDGCL